MPNTPIMHTHELHYAILHTHALNCHYCQLDVGVTWVNQMWVHFYAVGLLLP